MKVWLNEKYINEYDSITAFDAYWKQVTAQCFREGSLIHYLEINEIELYEQYELMIVQQFSQIQELKIYTITNHQAFVSSATELLAYMKKLRDYLDKVSSPFYGTLEKKNWDLFKQFTAGLEWVHQSSSFCLTLWKDYQSNDDSVRDLLEEIKQGSYENLGELESLLEKNDFVQIGDYLTYEMSDSLDEWIRRFEEDVRIA